MDKQAFVDRLRLCMLHKTMNGKPLTAYRLDKENVVKQSTMENYLKGYSSPDIETLARLAEYFCVSLDWLVTGVETSDKIFHDDPNDDLLNMLKKQQEILNRHEEILNKLVSIIDENNSGASNGSKNSRARKNK